MVKGIIDRFLRVPLEERNKRSLNLIDMFDGWKRKASQDLIKIKRKNALNKYLNWASSLDGFSLEQFMEFLVYLDQKMEVVKQRIDMINGTNHDYSNLNQAEALVLPSYQETPTNSTLMVPNDQIFCDDHHQILGYPNIVEGYNPFSWFNYPIISDNNGHNQDQYCPQLVNYNPNVFTNQVDDDNWFKYTNRNVMGGMSYDQGSGFVESIGASSTYGAVLPVQSNVPMQFPMVHNVPLQRHGQYQMFYK